MARGRERAFNSPMSVVVVVVVIVIVIERTMKFAVPENPGNYDNLDFDNDNDNDNDATGTL
jgi:hypothetical protein